MSDYFFVAQPASGHLNALMTIGKALGEKGNSVTFSTVRRPQFRQKLEGAGFHYVPVKPSFAAIGLIVLPFYSGYAETAFAMKQFYGGMVNFAKQYLKIFTRKKPEHLIADFGFPGACLAAEKLGIPYTIIYHAGLLFPGPGVPPFGTGLPIGEHWGSTGEKYQAMNKKLEEDIGKKFIKARKKLGLPRGMEDYASNPHSPWLTLVLTTDKIEAPRTISSDTTFFIGPCFSGRTGMSGDFDFSFLKSDRKKIYISLGTVFNNKPHVFLKLIEALDNENYQLIVSAGGSYNKLKREDLPANVHIFPSVPQVELLPQIDVMISHGGNNTVNETLAAGKPILVIPVGGEQGDNASKIVYLRCGLRADIDNFRTDEIRHNITRILTEPVFSEAAQKAKDAIAKTQGTITAITMLEYLTKNKKPVERPPDYPLTIEKNTPMPWEYERNNHWS